MFHPDRLLTEPEAQKLLGVSRTTLWRLRTRQGLPFLRLGSEIRYDTTALNQWLADQSQETTLRELRLDEPCNSSERDWKQAIEESDWSFEDERTDSVTHGLHPYPAKFPPPLPRRLIEVLSKQGETVLDPFCGSGTTLVEAKSLGRRSLGVDSNPVAVLASLAKTLTLDEEGFDALELLSNKVASDIARITGQPNLHSPIETQPSPVQPPEIPNRERWFTTQAMHELGLILAQINGMASASAVTVARACFSAIVIRASNQDSETRYTARPKHWQPGQVLERFRDRLADAVRMHREWALVASTEPSECFLMDTRELRCDDVGIADAAITSPPYANAFDYHLYHRHRLFWLGFDPRNVRQVEIGSHLNHQNDNDAVGTYRTDMQASLRSIASCLRSGRPIAIVVGDSVFRGNVISNASMLSEIGRNVGLRTLACVDRKIHPSKRSMIPPARRARAENILLLVKD